MTKSEWLAMAEQARQNTPRFLQDGFMAGVQWCKANPPPSEIDRRGPKTKSDFCKSPTFGKELATLKLEDELATLRAEVKQLRHKLAMAVAEQVMTVQAPLMERLALSERDERIAKLEARHEKLRKAFEALLERGTAAAREALREDGE